MAKQISVSDEVYRLLLSMKSDNKSFSDVINGLAAKKKSGRGIMKYAGILKSYGKELEGVEKRIAADRKLNRGRAF